MESQQDIVDLTISDDDNCLFPTEPGEMVRSLLEMGGMVDNKEISKQNHVKKEEHDTLSICGLKDSEILTDREEEKEEEESKISTDGEEEKEEESKKIIFKRIWPNLQKKTQEKPCSNMLHLMFTHAAIKLSIQGKWKCSVWDSR